MKRFLIGTLILIVIAVLFYSPILRALGTFLVHADPPQKADTIIVLAGDGYGSRILEAAKLVREGYAPQALVSGPPGFYSFHECDLAIPFAVKSGYPESYFVHFENDAHSTFEEAQAFSQKLHAIGAHHILLVTSNYHTRRAGKLFHRVIPDIQIDVVAAPDTFYTPDGWWHNRESRKQFLLEWTKTISEWL